MRSYFIMFNCFAINMFLQLRGAWRYVGDASWRGRATAVRSSPRCRLPTRAGIGWWRNKSTGWNDGYMFGEKMYQILSLVAKSLLLWLVVGGTNQPNSFTQDS